MNFQQIRYRTTGLPVDRWAVIPDFYVSDFLRWLELSETTELVSLTALQRVIAPVTDLLSELIAPRDWPSYRTCASFVRDTVLLGER